MKHVEFKKHLAISRDGVDGSTPLACRRGLLPKTMGSGRSQTKVDRSKCKTGAEMRRGRPARPPSDTFEWCGVKFKVKRPPVEAEPAVREEPPIDAVPEAAPREPRPGTAARKAAADITASVVDDLGGSQRYVLAVRVSSRVRLSETWRVLGRRDDLGALEAERRLLTSGLGKRTHSVR